MQDGLPERQYDQLNQLELFSDAVAAINGSKFNTVNSSDRNFTDLGNTNKIEPPARKGGRLYTVNLL